MQWFSWWPGDDGSLGGLVQLAGRWERAKILGEVNDYLFTFSKGSLGQLFICSFKYHPAQHVNIFQRKRHIKSALNHLYSVSLTELSEGYIKKGMISFWETPMDPLSSWINSFITQGQSNVRPIFLGSSIEIKNRSFVVRRFFTNPLFWVLCGLFPSLKQAMLFHVVLLIVVILTAKCHRCQEGDNMTSLSLCSGTGLVTVCSVWNAAGSLICLSALCLPGFPAWHRASGTERRAGCDQEGRLNK